MKKRSLAKVLGWLLAAVMVISLLPASTLSARAEGSGWNWTRLEGQNRYATMQAITGEACKTAEEKTFKTLIVSTGDSFPDALSGSALAGVYGCPIITTKSASLSAQAKSELQRLAASGATVLILGGETAVSKNVENAIKKLGLKTERVAGTTRVKTAIEVYKKGAAAANGFKGNDTVIITTGFNYADALSISPYAYAAKTPILLTNKNGTLATEVKDVIKSAGFKKAVIVGGTSAVAEDTESYLKKQGLTVLRLEGKNRYLTSAQIVKWEMGLLKSAAFQPAVKMTNAGMGVATGDNYPDALASAGLLGKTKSVLMLVSNTKSRSTIQKNIDELIKPYAESMGKGYIFGGENAVSKEIEALLNEAVGGSGEQPEEGVLTVDEVLAIMERYENGDVSDKIYTVKGVATSSSFNSDHSSYKVWLQSNDGSNAQAFQLFSVGMDPSIEKEEYHATNALKGMTVTCTGYLQKYSDTSFEMPYLAKDPADETKSYTPMISKVEGEAHTKPEDHVENKEYTVSELLAAMSNYEDGMTSQVECTVTGVVSSASINSYGSFDIYLKNDDGSVEQAFMLYSSKFDSSITTDYSGDKVNNLVGKTVTCKGYVKLYGTTYEMPYMSAGSSPTGSAYTPMIIKVDGEGGGGEEPPVDPPVGDKTPEEIVAALYALEENTTLAGGPYELEGKIIGFNDPYNATTPNVSVTIVVGTMTDKPVQAYRLTAESDDMKANLAKLKSGDTIKVKGQLKDYKGTKEFDQGCLLLSYTAGTGSTTVYTSPEEIVNALYALDAGFLLSDGYLYELEGKVSDTSGDVTMTVGTLTDKPIACYKLAGANDEMTAALKKIKVGDTIKVKGALKNYNGTYEFVSGCVLTAYTAGEGGEEPPAETADVTIISAKLGVENDTAVPTITSGDITISFSQGTHDSLPPKYFTSGAAIRFYKGNTFTITAGNGKKIAKVVFTFTGASNAGNLVQDTGSYSVSGKVGTWTGNTASVTFENAPEDKTQARVVQFEIFYAN